MPVKLELRHKLFEIARLQEGLFTSKQAQEAGFLPKNFSGHVKRGNWIKVQRGLYRLADFNINEVPFELTKWHLWSRNRNDEPQGVFSYLTALSIFELGNELPAKIHMTVPIKFRKFNSTPTEIEIYRENLSKGDFIWVNSYRVTSIFKTLTDIKTSSYFSDETFTQAFHDATQKNKLTKKQIKDLEK